MACFSHLLTETDTERTEPTMGLLTRRVAAKATKLAMQTFTAMAEDGITVRHALHVVVMNPLVTLAEGWEFDDAVLYEFSLNREDWADDYEAFARAKAEMSWRTGKDGHYVQQLAAHLLSDGNTKYAGSAVLDGIVVAASGVQGYFDWTISLVIAALCRGLCIDAMQKVLKDEGAPLFFEFSNEDPEEEVTDSEPAA